jgi:hypothetical protein
MAKFIRIGDNIINKENIINITIYTTREGQLPPLGIQDGKTIIIHTTNGMFSAGFPRKIIKEKFQEISEELNN